MLKVGDRIEFWYFEVMWRGSVIKVYENGTGIDLGGCQTVLLDPPILLSIGYKSLDRPPVLLERKGSEIT